MIASWNETNTYEQWVAFKPSLPARAEVFTGIALTSTGPHARRIMPELLAEWPHVRGNGKPKIALYLKPGTVGGVTTPDQSSSWSALADYFAAHAPDCDWGIDAETWAGNWFAAQPDDAAIDACAAGIHSLAINHPGRFMVYGFGLWGGETYNVRLACFRAIFGEPVRSLFRDDGQYSRKVWEPEKEWQLWLARFAATQSKCHAYTRIMADGWTPEELATGLRERRWPSPVLVYAADEAYVGRMVAEMRN